MGEDKKAFAVRQQPDGKMEVLAAATGKAAEKLLEAASDSGLEVLQDGNLAEEMERKAERSVSPEQVWDDLSVLVAEIEGFVEELDDLWGSGGSFNK